MFCSSPLKTFVCWFVLKTAKYCHSPNTHRDEIGCLHKTDFVIRPPAGLGFEKWVKYLKNTFRIILLDERIFWVFYMASMWLSWILVTLDDDTKYLKEVSEIEYPDNEYPTNCYGTFYILSSNVRDRLYQVDIAIVVFQDHWSNLHIAGLHWQRKKDFQDWRCLHHRWPSQEFGRPWSFHVMFTSSLKNVYTLLKKCFYPPKKCVMITMAFPHTLYRHPC